MISVQRQLVIRDKIITSHSVMLSRISPATVDPIQQKFGAMNGAHLSSSIRGELGYAHRPQLGSQIHCPIGNHIWGPLGKEDVCPNFALTVTKFEFSNSGNFRAKPNPPNRNRNRNLKISKALLKSQGHQLIHKRCGESKGVFLQGG